MAATGRGLARQRRRGPELESALLSAAWDELVESGFARLTMESVATRAHTGIAVLYRRWGNKDELVLAALEHHRSTHPIEIADTGALRDDLLGVLTAMSEARSGFWAIAVASAFSGLLSDSGLTPGQARDKILGEGPRRTESARVPRLSRVWEIYQRAHDRGEIDLDRLPPAVLSLPFDLVRHDLLLDLKPLPHARLRSIVDDLFMPLVAHHQGTLADSE